MERLLDDQVRNELREFFQDMPPVRLIAVIDEEKPTCEYCPQIKQLLLELQEISPSIKVEFYTSKDKEIVEKYRVNETPVIIIEGGNKGLIRYLGIPAHHEFSVFVSTIKEAALGHAHVPDEVKPLIERIKRPVHLLVFVTPQCPHCPLAVHTAYTIAAANPYVIADAVEANEFQDLSLRYRIRAVPTIVINGGKGRFEGALPFEHFVKEILRAIGEDIRED